MNLHYNPTLSGPLMQRKTQKYGVDDDKWIQTQALPQTISTWHSRPYDHSSLIIHEDRIATHTLGLRNGGHSSIVACIGPDSGSAGGGSQLFNVRPAVIRIQNLHLDIGI